MYINIILYYTCRIIHDHGGTHKYASHLIVGHDFTARVEIQNKHITTHIIPHDERETPELIQDISLEHYISVVCELYGVVWSDNAIRYYPSFVLYGNGATEYLHLPFHAAQQLGQVLRSIPGPVVYELDSMTVEFGTHGALITPKGIPPEQAFFLAGTDAAADVLP